MFLGDTVYLWFYHCFFITKHWMQWINRRWSTTQRGRWNNKVITLITVGNSRLNCPVSYSCLSAAAVESKTNSIELLYKYVLAHKLISVSDESQAASSTALCCRITTSLGYFIAY